jgi:hypothetical protein
VLCSFEQEGGALERGPKSQLGIPSWMTVKLFSKSEPMLSEFPIVLNSLNPLISEFPVVLNKAEVMLD